METRHGGLAAERTDQEAAMSRRRDAIKGVKDLLGGGKDKK